MIEKTVDRDKILKVLHEEFEAGRGVWLTVTGSSMEPLLRHLRDKVILMPPEKYIPGTGDIVFSEDQEERVFCTVLSGVLQKADI